MGLGSDIGVNAVEELNKDVPQWIMQLRQVAMDVVDYAKKEFVGILDENDLVISKRKHAKEEGE